MSTPTKICRFTGCQDPVENPAGDQYGRDYCTDHADRVSTAISRGAIVCPRCSHIYSPLDPGDLDGGETLVDLDRCPGCERAEQSAHGELLARWVPVLLLALVLSLPGCGQDRGEDDRTEGISSSPTPAAGDDETSPTPEPETSPTPEPETSPAPTPEATQAPEPTPVPKGGANSSTEYLGIFSISGDYLYVGQPDTGGSYLVTRVAGEVMASQSVDTNNTDYLLCTYYYLLDGSGYGSRCNNLSNPQYMDGGVWYPFDGELYGGYDSSMGQPQDLYYVICQYSLCSGAKLEVCQMYYGEQAYLDEWGNCVGG